MLLFNGSALSGPGETWTWAGAGANWVQQPVASPSARVGASLAFDDARGKAVLFGGLVRRVMSGITYTSLDATTWLWDGSTWSTAVPAVSPPARYGASMAYEAAHQRVVLFGGCANTTCSVRLNDTWTWGRDELDPAGAGRLSGSACLCQHGI
jgi:hypothetical protein